MAAHETTGFPKKQLRVYCALRARSTNMQLMVETHDGERLARLMKRSGTSNQALADATHVSVQAVGKWKRDGTIAREQIAPICRAIRASADELLGLTPMAGVAESPAMYQAGVDIDALQRAIYLVEDALAQPGMEHVGPDWRTEMIMAVYEGFRLSAPDPEVQAFLSRILKTFASREVNKEPGETKHGVQRR